MFPRAGESGEAAGGQRGPSVAGAGASGTRQNGDGGWVGRTPSVGGLQARSGIGGEIRGWGLVAVTATGLRTPQPLRPAAEPGGARERAYAGRERARDAISTSRPDFRARVATPLPGHLLPRSPRVSPRPGKSGSFFTDGPGKPPGCLLRTASGEWTLPAPFPPALPAFPQPGHHKLYPAYGMPLSSRSLPPGLSSKN
ncbi:uncharacterized protein LOC121099916 isoform X2 [Ursus maritimus]|uniref:Uncharacterized protein LOC121099916 isoform X2 n=1 Tax=Ursus maritimus TaxID=29073 RepID=A0A8M1EX34_URSMA|nr:uncharacterized protein LOC121099916 isoform X2 [Ursus maritimus]